MPNSRAKARVLLGAAFGLAACSLIGTFEGRTMRSTLTTPISVGLASLVLTTLIAQFVLLSRRAEESVASVWTSFLMGVLVMVPIACAWTVVLFSTMSLHASLAVGAAGLLTTLVAWTLVSRRTFIS